MPITVEGMADAIVAARNARSDVADTEDGVSGGAIRRADALALAEAIVPYLLANALVTGACPSGGGPLVAGRIT